MKNKQNQWLDTINSCVCKNKKSPFGQHHSCGCAGDSILPWLFLYRQQMDGKSNAKVFGGFVVACVSGDSCDWFVDNHGDSLFLDSVSDENTCDKNREDDD